MAYVRWVFWTASVKSIENYERIMELVLYILKPGGETPLKQLLQFVKRIVCIKLCNKLSSI